MLPQLPLLSHLASIPLLEPAAVASMDSHKSMVLDSKLAMIVPVAGHTSHLDYSKLAANIATDTATAAVSRNTTAAAAEVMASDMDSAFTASLDTGHVLATVPTMISVVDSAARCIVAGQDSTDFVGTLFHACGLPASGLTA